MANIPLMQTSGSPIPQGSANLIYATPDGSNGAASLRALAAGDFPVLNVPSAYFEV